MALKKEGPSAGYAYVDKEMWLKDKYIKIAFWTKEGVKQ